jgi:NitT/TauT family transport system permease protein
VGLNVLRTAERIRRRAGHRRHALVRIGQIVVVVALLGSWELAAQAGWLPNADMFYSRPTQVASFLWENAGVLWVQTLSTVWAAMLGILSGILTGGLAGLALGRWTTADRILDPIMAVFAGLPRIALAPLFLLWFGITDMAKIALSFSVVFFIMLFNARAGVRSVDHDLRTQAVLLGARGHQVFGKIVLPGAVPVLFGGMRLSIAFGFLGVIASEMVAARQGLGISVVQYGQLLEPAGVFAVLVVLAVIMGALNGIVALTERRLLRWTEDG